MNHTPGPWTVQSNGPLGTWWVEATGHAKRTVCHMSDAGLTERGQADARLIAASPELFAVLKEVEASASALLTVDPAAKPKGTLLRQIRAAIAKAEGR